MLPRQQLRRAPFLHQLPKAAQERPARQPSYNPTPARPNPAQLKPAQTNPAQTSRRRPRLQRQGLPCQVR